VNIDKYRSTTWLPVKPNNLKKISGNGSTANSTDSSIQITWRSKHMDGMNGKSHSHIFIIASGIRDIA